MLFMILLGELPFARTCTCNNKHQLEAENGIDELIMRACCVLYFLFRDLMNTCYNVSVYMFAILSLLISLTLSPHLTTPDPHSGGHLESLWQTIHTFFDVSFSLASSLYILEAAWDNQTPSTPRFTTFPHSAFEVDPRTEDAWVRERQIMRISEFLENALSSC